MSDNLLIVLTAMLGGGFFVLWLTTVLLAPDGAVRIDPDTLRRNGPAFLVAYCLMNVFVTSGERSIYFSPGEVNFHCSTCRRSLVIFSRATRST